MEHIGHLAQEITLENGRIQQSYFHDHSLMRMRQTPKNRGSWRKTDYAPRWLGELTLPPGLPVVTNATFATTGERIRTLLSSAAGSGGLEC